MPEYARARMKDTCMTPESWQNRWNSPLITYGWLVICCVASGILAIIVSVHRPLWLDELYMLITVRRPFINSLLQTEDYSAPLYQLITRLFVHRDIPETFFFRLPALMFAMFGLFSIWWLAKTLFSTMVAAMSIFIIGFNPCFLDHAAEARPYSMFLLFSVLSVGTFYMCLISYNRFSIMAYVCSSVLLVYTHYFGLLVFPAQALTLLVYVVHTRQKAILKKMGFAMGTVFLLCIPAFYLISRYISGGLIALSGISEAHLAALSFSRSGTSFFADSHLFILCLWPLMVMAWNVLNRLRSKGFFGAESKDLSVQSCASWYLTPLLAIAWILFSWYLLVIVSCFEPGYSDRYVFPALVPFVLILSAITISGPCRLPVLILMLVSYSYIFNIKNQIVYVNRDFPELAAHLRSVNNSETIVFIADLPVLNDIDPVECGLRYYGYAETNVLHLALAVKTGGAGLEIQKPDLLNKDDHYFVVTRKPEYEHCVDDYMAGSALQFSKARFGWLTLYEVHKLPTQL
jgi:hypothetical protein